MFSDALYLRRRFRWNSFRGAPRFAYIFVRLCVVAGGCWDDRKTHFTIRHDATGRVGDAQFSATSVRLTNPAIILDGEWDCVATRPSERSARMASITTLQVPEPHTVTVTAL